MLKIDCPWCGDRDETEFTFGGQTGIVRPLPEAQISDAQWADYLYLRDNTKGLQHERWRHSYGCRQWFNIERHTLSHEITAVYKIGERD